MRDSKLRAWLVGLSAVACLTAPLAAQEQVKVPIQIALGRRADLPRTNIPAVPTLVIVDSREAFAAALGQWNTRRRFPVLIDDGSAWSRHAIGRFAHAYRPERIVRWQPAERPTLPPAGPERRAALEAHQARAWNVENEDPSQIVARWASDGWVPPGIVIADDRDSAWPAALTLAIGRGLPLVWVDSLPNPVDHAARPEHAAMLSAAASEWAEQQALDWNVIGDQVDAITVCLNDPARIEVGPDDTRAMTDIVGRHEDGRRWAWASQIFGSETRSAYMAMCSLFIQPRSVWVFDAYGTEEPWVFYDGTQAGDLFSRVKDASGEGELFPDVRVFDEPQQGLADWHAASSRGIGGSGGGIALVNSSGNNDFFDLAPGRAHPGDVPHLLGPTLVHFVHSWSALFPGNRDTVGGRWIDRGAFAYVGAIQEPGLQGFVPTPIFGGRLITQAPFAATARMVSGEAGRVATFGDALYCIGFDTPRTSEHELPFEEVVDVAGELRRAVSEQDWPAMFQALELQGDYARSARLVEAMLRDRPQEVSPSVARAALFAVSTQSDPSVMFDLYRKLSPSDAREPWARDLLWSAARRGVPPGGSSLLVANIREGQAETDREELELFRGR